MQLERGSLNSNVENECIWKGLPDIDAAGSDFVRESLKLRNPAASVSVDLLFCRDAVGSKTSSG